MSILRPKEEREARRKALLERVKANREEILKNQKVFDGKIVHGPRKKGGTEKK